MPAKVRKLDIATEVIRENPTWPNRTVARFLVDTYPDIFATVDSARDIVRKAVGAHGKSNLNQIRCPKPHGKAGEHRVPSMPESHEKPRQDFHLPTGRGVILSDIHAPYHDVPAIEAALDKITGLGPVDWVLFNGDTVDCHHQSDFVVDPRLVDLKAEMRVGGEIIAYILDAIGAQKAFFKLGNHEARVERDMLRKAPSFANFELWRWDELMRKACPDLEAVAGLEYIQSAQTMWAGKLAIIHGHEYRFGISAPVNPARGLYLRSKVSTICGHHHQTSEHSEPDLSGSIVTCWSTGCLCGLSPAYMPNNKWNHGFAIVEVDDEGLFHVDNYRIRNGVVM